ncbi:MAG: LytTR family DNA-binding domain-containing protein [Bacteroidota bacterium]
MINCLIVDDEPLATQLLSSYVSKIEDLNLLESFNNSFEAWTFLQKEEVDLVFLDIQMPELNGVQLARLLGDKTQVIFTTAYPDYAVEGFELKALDYLVKPINLQRFLQAVDRYREKNTEATTVKGADSNSFIFVKTEYRHQKIDLKDILYLKGMGDYVSIYTESGRILTLENMKSFESRLAMEQFMRVHKSYLVAMDKIDFVEKNRIRIREELIPIGATYQEAFWKRLKA